jgi:hypothetical protein
VRDRTPGGRPDWANPRCASRKIERALSDNPSRAGVTARENLEAGNCRSTGGKSKREGSLVTVTRPRRPATGPRTRNDDRKMTGGGGLPGHRRKIVKRQASDRIKARGGKTQEQKTENKRQFSQWARTPEPTNRWHQIRERENIGALVADSKRSREKTE